MSFYTDSSLVLIPSGIKDQKVYCAKPVDGSADLTFSRGSDIEATRVNANGYIEKAQVNLLLQSNSFDTTWSLGGGTLTSGQTGYDGSNDAWLFTYTSNAAIVSQTNTVNGVQTFSVYAKGSVSNGLRLYAFGSSNHFAYFDLNIGAVESTSGIIDANIEDKGNGWYRCSLTYDQTNTELYMYLSNNNNSNAGSGSILIQDAQLNYGLVAQTYQETTTAAVVSGITNDMPRLNYDPANPTCPSLLLEPSRTNIQDQSEYIASWLDINSTQESNYATSPEGVQNATRVVMDSATGEHSVYDSVSVTSGTKYTQSIFLKQGDGSANWRYFQFRFRSGGFGGLYGVVVDLQEGTIGYDTGLDDFGIESYGNGWHRVWITATATATSSNAGPVVAFNELADAYDVSIVGDTNADVLVWGAQFEAGSYPTSYIPTYGSSATRTADAASKTSIASLFNDSEGTLFAEIQAAGVDSATKVITIGDGSSLNRVQIFYQAGTNITTNVISGGTSQTTGFTTTFDQTQNAKVIIRYANNNAKFFLNGVEIASDTSVTTPTGLSGIYFNNGTGSADFLGLVKQLVYIPSALSDADCITLTA